MKRTFLLIIIFIIALANNAFSKCPTIYPYSHGTEKKYGYIDETGRIVIRPKFFNADDMAEGLARVEVTGDGRLPKYGFINGCGKMVIKPTYRAAFNFSEGLAAVLRPSKGWSFIDRTGNRRFNLGTWNSSVTPPVSKFSSGYALIYLQNGVHFINKNGKSVFGKIYDDASDFYNGVAVVKKDNKYAVIDTNGHYVIDLQKGEILISEDGITRIKDDKGIWTYFLTKGKKLFRDSKELNFSEGLAAFESEKKYGYVNTSGKVTIHPKFEYAGDFRNGLAVVSLNEREGVINKRGELVVDAIYKQVFPVDNQVIKTISLRESCFQTLSGRTFGCFQN